MLRDAGWYLAKYRMDPGSFGERMGSNEIVPQLPVTRGPSRRDAAYSCCADAKVLAYRRHRTTFR
jgi:hypothetical protein